MNVITTPTRHPTGATHTLGCVLPNSVSESVVHDCVPTVALISVRVILYAYVQHDTVLAHAPIR